MNRRDAILNWLRRGTRSGSGLARRLGISRQAVNLHLQRLVREGRVVRHGRTRGASFSPVGATQPAAAVLRRSYSLRGLEEDRVFEELDHLLNLRRRLRPNVHRIAAYAFTEMMNNAIEHSGARRCQVTADLTAYDFRFTIRDLGKGVFSTIRRKYHLKDENAAVLELLKGKTTTMAERHSGEGIFFTSRASDRFQLRSHRHALVFDNPRADCFVSAGRHTKGTGVDFTIRRQSRRRLDRIFAQYAPEEFNYRFERTRVFVRLHREALVSRSEARRMVHGLDRFREAVLDFRGVRTIGQAFADEVFRVFARSHPSVHLRVEGLSHELQTMIHHVLDNSDLKNLTMA